MLKVLWTGGQQFLVDAVEAVLEYFKKKVLRNHDANKKLLLHNKEL